METASYQSMTRYRQWTVIAIVLIGMGLSLAEALSDPAISVTTLQVVAAIIAALIYLGLSLQEEKLLGPGSSDYRLLLYLIVQVFLIELISWLLQTLGGNWLLAMPLVGTITGRLSGARRILAIAAVFLAIVVPVFFRFGLSTAVNYGISVLAAFIFVALFILLVVRAEDARREAEELARELEIANRQLTNYAAQAEELAISKERNRLAREIHDSLGHFLTVINVQLEAARVVMDDEPARALEAIAKAQKMAQDGLTAVRESVAALRESPLGSRHLDEGIAALIEETSRSGILSEYEVKGERRRLEPNAELTLFRAAQEGLTNVRKHARASRVDLILDYTNSDKVQLLIQDNGVGATTTDSDGFGLLGIRERVDLLGGQLEVDSAVGQGFKMTVTVPG